MGKKKYAGKTVHNLRSEGSGRYINDEKAQIIGDFLDKKFPKGEYTAHQILDVARPKKSPIHWFFEWDDTKAAEAYRLMQAASLIVRISVVVNDEPLPAAMRLKVEEDGDKEATAKYYTEERIQKSENLLDQVSLRAHAQLKNWCDRYKNFTGLKRFVGEVEKVERKYDNG